MSSKPLGFGNRHVERGTADVASTLSLAANMKPQPVSNDLPTAQQVERIVDSQEGVIRQQPLKISSKRKNKGIVQPLNMRVRLTTHNRFVELSKALRLPYDETLEWILERAGVDQDGNPPM